KIEGVRVPRVRTPDGIRMPPLYAELRAARREETVRLARDGYSTRTVERRTRRTAGTTDGRSSSNVQRVRADGQMAAVEEMQSRRFDDVPVVAVMLDGTAIGRGAGGRQTAVVATGVLADGRRVALGAVVGPTESAELVGSLVRDLVARGVDRRVLWIADQGQGIRSAVEGLFPEPDLRPAFQVCTVHKARNVAEHLRPVGEQVQDDVRRRMYRAWASRDPEEAVRGLAEIADDLQARGERAAGARGKKARRVAKAYLAAAESLRTNAPETATVLRLGLRGPLLRQLRSTNVQESANSWLKQAMARVTNWSPRSRHADPGESARRQRLNWVAEGFLEQEREVWTRFADVEGLIGLSERLLPGRHDVAALRDAAPPLLSVERLSVPSRDRERAGELATEALGGGESGIALGFGPALAEFGLAHGQTVDRTALRRALQGLEAGVGAGGPQAGAGPAGADPDEGVRRVRRLSELKEERVDADGTAEKISFEGVAGARWSFAAPSRVGELWRGADAAGRAAIERAVLASAEVAVTRVARATGEREGVAAVGRLTVVERGDGVEVRVDGALLGVKRGDAAITTPAARETFTYAEARRAEDAAAAPLRAAIAPQLAADRAAQEHAAALRRRADAGSGGPRDPLTPQRRKLLGAARVAQLEARADVLERALADRDVGWLRSRRAALGDPFQGLDGDVAAALGGRRLERDRAIARRDLTAARDALEKQPEGSPARELAARRAANASGRLERLRETEQGLRDQGRDLDGWLRAPAVGSGRRPVLSEPGPDGGRVPLNNHEALARAVALERAAAALGVDLAAAERGAARERGSGRGGERRADRHAERGLPPRAAAAEAGAGM
ncbi:MAG: hypothetical protein GXY03_04610, partial [Solirubrobacterales bacterium]|nr:hypothetical protein [Solirubrobacterales bacterium]